MSQVTANSTATAAQGATFEHYVQAVTAAERLLHHVKSAVRGKVGAAGKSNASQATAHGLAWFATYVEALRQMSGWATRLEEDGRLGEMERLLLAAAFGEYLAQMAGGIPMSQGETVRAAALGVPRVRSAPLRGRGVAAGRGGLRGSDQAPACRAYCGATRRHDLWRYGARRDAERDARADAPVRRGRSAALCP